jgi:hypothetical protein
MNVEIMANEEDMKNRWKTYFQHLNETTVEQNTFLDNTGTHETETEPEIINEPPDILDTEVAIKSLRK